MTQNSTDLSQWQQRIETYCKAWTTDTGKPDFETLSTFYAKDNDVVIYDSLPPLEGFTGFDQMTEIYPGLTRLEVLPNRDLRVKYVADNRVAITAFTSQMSYTFENGKTFKIKARHSDVWEKRGDAWLIVHEHPSTTIEFDE